jgi:hypothetical protein
MYINKNHERIKIEQSNMSDLRISNYKIVNKEINSNSKNSFSQNLFDSFLKIIKDKLIELWNISSTFDELAFLIFHINEMPPFTEIYLESNLTMLLEKKDIIERKYPSRMRGINATIIYNHEQKVDLSDLSKLSKQTLEQLEIGINKTLGNLDPRDYRIYDEEFKFSYYIELLGYATTYLAPVEVNNGFNFGRIGLDLKKIKEFNKNLKKDKDFYYFLKHLEYCLGYKMNAKDLGFKLLLEKVFYHEFGHLYFGHCNKKTNDKRELVNNPDQKRESYANFFASMIFDSLSSIRLQFFVLGKLTEFFC